MDITVVTMVHNRHDNRIERFINSLILQSTVPYEVIIVDTSPSPKEHLCQAVTYISIPCTTLSKSLALNVGLRKVRSPYTLFTDIDIIFHPNFLKEVTKLFIADRTAFVQAVTAYLPPGVTTSNWEELVTLAMNHEPEVSARLSPGACQATATSWFKAVRGYDEKFKNLGGMDVDMMIRARIAGLENYWIDRVMTLHQWHEKSKYKGVDSHLFNGNPPLVANGKEWGIW